MGYLLNDHEDHPNQHKNNEKQRNEKECPSFTLKKSQWKLRKKQSKFPKDGKATEEVLESKERNKSKRVRDPKRKIIHK